MKITILTDDEALEWQLNRRTVVQDFRKGCKIDGIMDERRWKYTFGYMLFVLELLD